MEDERKTSEGGNHAQATPTANPPQPINPPSTLRAGADQPQQARKEMSGFERGMLIATIAAVVVSCIYAFLAFRQMHVMKGQLDQMTSAGAQTDNLIIQAIAQNEATNTLAQQAERSNEIAEKTLKTNEALSKIALKQGIVISRLEQRAWISVLSVQNIKPQNDKPLNIPVTIKNTGKTPALDVTALACASVVKKNVKPTFSYNKILDPIQSRMIILPNDEKTTEINIEDSQRISADGKLTKEAIDYLNSGKETIYIYGKITYKDIFDEQHWTTFCYIYNPVDGYSIICEEYNNMDK